MAVLCADLRAQNRAELDFARADGLAAELRAARGELERAGAELQLLRSGGANRGLSAAARRISPGTPGTSGAEGGARTAGAPSGPNPRPRTTSGTGIGSPSGAPVAGSNTRIVRPSPPAARRVPDAS